ncbi:AraC family transcriptional regulator [Acuticoccus sediminis]|uniref:AraC family transcriptional regulator n=1 Tax=Acuticoccus sediminis TaxID=2184697 RepID=UPI0013912565|nr:AraC family transcriptional regulator [Acuticoccus sediminis]
MSRPAIHFAPKPQRLAHFVGAGALTVLSITALAGVPGFVRNAFGEKVLRHANRAAMLDIEAIEDRDCFIPHATMTSFLVEVERRAGEPTLGLMLAPHLSLDGYGCWGEYIFGGETLKAAIDRGMKAIGYQSRGDRTALSVEGGLARFCYFSAARGRDGYGHVAVGAIGVMLSLCRAYLSPAWRPLQIDLDIPLPTRPAAYEDAFQCPVRFDAPVAAVWFEAHLLRAPRRGHQIRRLLTVEDVARARLEPASREDLIGVVSAHIWAQVLTGSVSIDSTARALDTSVRSLQRTLHQHGTDFRKLSNIIRAKRARELIVGTNASITEIAAELGYTAPANFARAFRKDAGTNPGDFRRAMRISPRH